MNEENTQYLKEEESRQSLIVVVLAAALLAIPALAWWLGGINAP